MFSRAKDPGLIIENVFVFLNKMVKKNLWLARKCLHFRRFEVCCFNVKHSKLAFPNFFFPTQRNIDGLKISPNC